MYDFIDVVVAPSSNELWAAGVDTCTSPGCKAASGTTLAAAEKSSDAQGFVVRQLSGPGLGRVVAPATPVKRSVAKPASGGGSLPATGLGLTVPVVALMAVGFSLLLRRRTA